MAQHDSLGQIRTQQRDLWIATSLVLLALTAGVVLNRPSISLPATVWADHLPTWWPTAGLLFLVGSLVIYLWVKGAHVQRLARSLADEHGRSDDLALRLDTVRGLVESSSRLRLDRGTAAGLTSLLEDVARALHADRVVLYRCSSDGHLERDVVFPSGTQAPAPAVLRYEDALAAAAVSCGCALEIADGVNPSELGLPAQRPDPSYRDVAAAPLHVDGAVAGALVVRNPEAMADATWETSGRELFGVFADFASGVLENLRAYQEETERAAELDRAHKQLQADLRETQEVELATSMTRIAASMAHALSGPLTSMQGFASELTHDSTPSAHRERARGGMQAEFLRMRDRLQTLIDFTASYRCRYELVDLSDMLMRSVDQTRKEFDQAQVPLTVEPYERLPLTMVDVVRMRQVQCALLRFTAQASARRRPVAVRILPYSGHVRLELRGHVHAGAHEALKPLLQPNLELPQLRRAHDLDLAIACHVIQSHQGDVSVELGDDEAMLITVELPIRRDEPPKAKRTFSVAPSLDEAEERPEVVLDHLLRMGEPSAPSGFAPPAVQQPVPPADPVTGPAELEAARRSDSAPSPDGDLWDQLEAPPPPAPPPTRSVARETQPLLDPSEVECALRILDDDP